MEELERKTEEEIIQKKELRRKIKEKLFLKSPTGQVMFGQMAQIWTCSL